MTLGTFFSLFLKGTGQHWQLQRRRKGWPWAIQLILWPCFSWQAAMNSRQHLHGGMPSPPDRPDHNLNWQINTCEGDTICSVLASTGVKNSHYSQSSRSAFSDRSPDGHSVSVRQHDSFHRRSYRAVSQSPRDTLFLLKVTACRRMCWDWIVVGGNCKTLCFPYPLILL